MSTLVKVLTIAELMKEISSNSPKKVIIPKPKLLCKRQLKIKATKLN